MPIEVEKKLRTAGRRQGLHGKDLDHFVYGLMNKEGFMKGNKPTGKQPKKKKEEESTHSRFA